MAYLDQATTAETRKTAFAVLLAIFIVIPALLPAAAITIVYAFFLKFFISGGSWLPYTDVLALTIIPELLRGAVVGGIAIWVSRYFFPQSNLEAIRLATMAFWGAILLLLLIFSLSAVGFTLDTIGGIACAVGLGIGLWSIE
ncbi:hypothetical protein [Paenochrobactrum pullorum]|uniref:hypothetical protein n=1 Tax=Paenochrobactrum pullorum TaxID=1324351 RepID=UPI0035BC17F0